MTTKRLRRQHARDISRARALGDEDAVDEMRAEWSEDCAFCSMCGGELRLLGTLGNTNHLRCRDCGMESTS